MNILSYADSETDNWQQVVLAQDTNDMFIVNYFDGKSARKSYYTNKDQATNFFIRLCSTHNLTATLNTEHKIICW